MTDFVIGKSGEFRNLEGLDLYTPVKGDHLFVPANEAMYHKAEAKLEEMGLGLGYDDRFPQYELVVNEGDQRCRECCTWFPATNDQVIEYLGGKPFICPTCLGNTVENADAPSFPNQHLAGWPIADKDTTLVLETWADDYRKQLRGE